MATARKYEVPTEDEIDYAEGYANRLENGFSKLQDHFGDWIAEKTEPNFKTAKELEAFRLGAKTALWLRMYHQRSPENHEFKAELAEAAENGAAEREEAKAARIAEREEKRAAAEQERAARAAEREARKAAKAGESTPAPAKPARAAAAAKPAAAKTTGRPARSATAAKPARRPAATGTAKPARRAAKAEAEF